MYLDDHPFLIFQLRWDEIWPIETKDLDLYLYRVDDDGSPILVKPDSSDAIRVKSTNYPHESIYVPATLPKGCYCLSIVKRTGSDPDWIQLHSYSLSGEEFSFKTSTSYSYGGIITPAESANPGMLAVGAAPWDNSFYIADYSSRGPTPDGRAKPDIVGATGAYSSAHYSFATEEGDRNSFEGTSQAAPHVAGMAALVRQRFPNYSPAEVVNYLKSNAKMRDAEEDDSWARGSVPNNTWGHGFARLPLIPGQCSNGIAVPQPQANPGLVADCENLLAARDAFTNGRSVLNWSTTLPVDQMGRRNR